MPDYTGMLALKHRSFNPLNDFFFNVESTQYLTFYILVTF